MVQLPGFGLGPPLRREHAHFRQLAEYVAAATRAIGVDRLDALAFTDVPPCARLPDVEAFALASIGEQGAGFVTRDRRTRAIAYGPLFGSDLALLVEEAVTPQPDEIVLVRAGIIGTAALVLLAYRAGQRSRKAPPAASAPRGDRA